MTSDTSDVGSKSLAGHDGAFLRPLEQVTYACNLFFFFFLFLVLSTRPVSFLALKGSREEGVDDMTNLCTRDRGRVHYNVGKRAWMNDGFNSIDKRLTTKEKKKNGKGMETRNSREEGEEGRGEGKER